MAHRHSSMIKVIPFVVVSPQCPADKNWDKLSYDTRSMQNDNLLEKNFHHRDAEAQRKIPRICSVHSPCLWASVVNCISVENHGAVKTTRISHDTCSMQNDNLQRRIFTTATQRHKEKYRGFAQCVLRASGPLWLIVFLSKIMVRSKRRGFRMIRVVCKMIIYREEISPQRRRGTKKNTEDLLSAFSVPQRLIVFVFLSKILGYRA